MAKTIGLFVGSLRKESFSRKIAQSVIGMAPSGFEFKIIEIGELPMFNQDFDDYDQTPESYSNFRQEVKALDGFIFITPEYNRSIPGVLKNALDVASRPYGQSVWDGKPAAIFSSSPGVLSGFGANHHLRQCLTFLNVFTMQQPEVYLAEIHKALGDNGELQGSVKDFVQQAVDAFVAWVQRCS